jgi:hypothetical protein
MFLSMNWKILFHFSHLVSMCKCYFLNHI